jgi:hypothetical protein
MRNLDVGCSLVRVWIVPCCDTDNDIDHDRQGSLQVVGFAITEEVANDKDGKDKENHHEDLEVEVHVLSKTPTNHDDERSVEEGRLDGGPKAVEEGKVDLVIPVYC